MWTLRSSRGAAVLVLEYLDVLAVRPMVADVKGQAQLNLTAPRGSEAYRPSGPTIGGRRSEDYREMSSRLRFTDDFGLAMA